MVIIEKGQSAHIESKEQVIEIKDFAGLGVSAKRYFVHPALQFARYFPPFYLKGQGNRPVFEWHINVPSVTVDEEKYIGISYFALLLGQDIYYADVSGSTSPIGDNRVRQYSKGHIFVMRQVNDRRWTRDFGQRSLSKLLWTIGYDGVPRQDDLLAQKTADDYAVEQARLAEERQRNAPLGLVQAAVRCPDGQTFVWTTTGNYYLPADVYQREWDAGLVPNQSMTIVALRANGIECVPTGEERPESVYGQSA